ncbi:hypothetical protein ACFSR7_18965 [Cohnella sp. GCM10020058]|uniref:hypothetical protein n=1 Tax=Cohnella sp. GCM10020058 TaxID=3317330 RepID=UPI00362A21E0
MAMIGAIGVAAGAAAIAVYEIRNLAAAREKKERIKNIAVFLSLLVLTSGLFAGFSLHARLPNPLAWIEEAVRAAGLQLGP